MIYRIVISILFVFLAAAAVLLAPGQSPDETTQSVQRPTQQQAPTPAQKSDDDALKGFKLN